MNRTAAKRIGAPEREIDVRVCRPYPPAPRFLFAGRQARALTPRKAKSVEQIAP